MFVRELPHSATSLQVLLCSNCRVWTPLVLMVLALGCAGPTHQTVPEEEFVREASSAGEDDDLSDLRGLFGLDESASQEQNSEQEMSDLMGALGVEETSTANQLAPAAPAGEQAKVSQMKELEARLDALGVRLEERALEINQLRSADAAATERLQRLSQKVEQITSAPRHRRRGSPPTWSAAHTRMNMQDAYKQALQLFQDRQYKTALKRFQSLLSRYPNHKLADNCQYWMGECLFALKAYSQAAVEFQKVFAYTNSDKADDAQFMTGVSYFRSGDHPTARQELQHFLDFYKKSQYRGRARAFLSRLEQ